MSKEAMKLALEALETVNRTDLSQVNSAITALRRALEQPAQQEPVGMTLDASAPLVMVPHQALEQPAQQEPEYWLWACGQHIQVSLKKPEFPDAIPLYTSPPAQRKPLTFSKLCDIEYEITHRDGDFSILKFARAIEAAHGIKGDA